jgi:hypothetical protein
VVSPDEKAFDDAVKSGDWATAAATSLVKVAMPTTKLPPLMDNGTGSGTLTV